MALKGDCSSITVSFVYNNHPGDAYIANMSLIKEAAVETATDEVTDEETPNTSETPETPDESTGTYCICGENCAYGEGCSCTCASEAECTCPQCKKKFNIAYDDFGNITSFSINGYDFGTLVSMFNARAYTSDGNYLSAVTNENNKQTQYLYN